jgi:hypothetical protein
MARLQGKRSAASNKRWPRPWDPREGLRREYEKSGSRRSKGVRTGQEARGEHEASGLAGENGICHPGMSDAVTPTYSGALTHGSALRQEPAERILQLACAMQGSRLGLSRGTQIRHGHSVHFASLPQSPDA